MQRIVDGIDLDAVRRDPKVVVGFSDITALQLALWRGARLATVHGPGAAWLDERTGPESAESLRRAVMTTEPVVVAARPGEETAPVRLTGAHPIAAGPLLGGNLCLLAASVGTPDQPDLRGAVLLLEEVAEPPYKVDRMLLHLRRSGALDGVAGVAVGQFTECADEWTTTIVDVLLEHLETLGVPVLGGLPIGHGRDQLTVPLGVSATLDARAGTLTVTPAVGVARWSFTAHWHGDGIKYPLPGRNCRDVGASGWLQCSNIAAVAAFGGAQTPRVGMTGASLPDFCRTPVP